MNWNEDAACRSAWRRIFSRSPVCIEILNEGKRKVPRYNKDGSRGKVDRVEYHCQVCNKWVPGSVGGKNNIAVDHIIPVIAVENIDGHVEDWNLFHRRLFCEKNNLQRICRPCHQKKTNEERQKRNTIKYNIELDKIAADLYKKKLDIKLGKLLLSKYKSKTRPQEIRDRAIRLIAEFIK